MQQDEKIDVNYDVVQPNIKFTSHKEQSLFYADILDDDPIDYHDVEIGKGIPEELTTPIEGSFQSAKQANMSRDGVQSLRKVVIE
jgi:hypothetical protein